MEQFRRFRDVLFLPDYGNYRPYFIHCPTGKSFPMDELAFSRNRPNAMASPSYPFSLFVYWDCYFAYFQHELENSVFLFHPEGQSRFTPKKKVDQFGTCCFVVCCWNLISSASVSEYHGPGKLGKDSWGRNIDNPPVAHAEEMTIEEISRFVLEISPEDYRSRIEHAGYQITDTQHTVENVCDQNKVAPFVFFKNTTKGLKVRVIPAKQ